MRLPRLLNLLVFTLTACTQPSTHQPTQTAIEASKTEPAVAPPSAQETDVIIVGAGIAGLVAAYELQKQGIATHILEEREILGGRVSTAHYSNGLKAEYGMQELWGGNPLISIAKALNVELEPPLRRSLQCADRMKIYPDIFETTDPKEALSSPAKNAPPSTPGWLTPKNCTALRPPRVWQILRSAPYRTFHSKVG
ncbi:MAG: FAD/NAD(P)-binding protein [Myxococcota bacterium]